MNLKVKLLLIIFGSILIGCDQRKEIVCSSDSKVYIKDPGGLMREPYLKQSCKINPDGTITLIRKQDANR